MTVGLRKDTRQVRGAQAPECMATLSRPLNRLLGACVTLVSDPPALFPACFGRKLGVPGPGPVLEAETVPALVLSLLFPPFLLAVVPLGPHHAGVGAFAPALSDPLLRPRWWGDRLGGCR